MHKTIIATLVGAVMTAAVMPGPVSGQDFVIPEVGPGRCVASCGGGGSSSGGGSSGSGSSLNLPSGFSGNSGLGKEFGSGDEIEGFSDRSSASGDGEQEKTLRSLLATVPEGSGTDTAAAALLFSGDGGGVVDPLAISGEFRSSAEAEHIVNWVSPDQLPTAEPYRDYSEAGFLQPLKDRIKGGAIDLLKSEAVRRIIDRVPQGSALKAIYEEGNSLYEALGEGIMVPLAENTLGDISDAVAGDENASERLIGFADQGGAGEAVEGQVDALVKQKIQDRVEGPIFEAESADSQYDQSGVVAMEGVESADVARARQLRTGQSSADYWSETPSNLRSLNNYIGKFASTR